MLKVLSKGSQYLPVSRFMFQARTQLLLHKHLVPTCGCLCNTLANYSSATPKPKGPVVGTYNKIVKRLGFYGVLSYRKSLLKASCVRLFMCITDLVEYDEFFKEFYLKDSFNSWFRITELHMWLLLARLAQEGDEGRYMRYHTTSCFFQDVAERARKLGGASASVRNQGLDLLYKQFHLALIGYDEGILDSDKVLAGCVWRLFFQMQCEDIAHIELLVHYIRKQMKHLDAQDSKILMRNGLVTWLPLKSEQINEQRTNEILTKICNLS